MATVVEITKLKLNPDVKPNPYVLNYVKRDGGLITPLVFYRDGRCHRTDVDRFMAFVQLASELENGRKTVIVVWIDELGEDEYNEIERYDTTR